MSELQIGAAVGFGWLFFVAIFVIISDGHKKAVEASEAALRAKYDAEGESGEASRKLMREAGYNV